MTRKYHDRRVTYFRLLYRARHLVGPMDGSLYVGRWTMLLSREDKQKDPRCAGRVHLSLARGVHPTTAKKRGSLLLADSNSSASSKNLERCLTVAGLSDRRSHPWCCFLGPLTWNAEGAADLCQG